MMRRIKDAAERTGAVLLYILAWLLGVPLTLLLILWIIGVGR